MSNLTFKIFTVDAFAEKAFRGNAATVVLLNDDQEIADEIKQQIAEEMKTSETAFVSKKQPQDTFNTALDFKLRWFTPKEEVPLCGHATLATAAVLFENGNRNESLNFETKSGILTATKVGERIALNLPTRPAIPLDKCSYKSLIESAVGENLDVVDIVYSPEERTVVLRLDDKTTMSQFVSFEPKFDRMMAFNEGDIPIRGVNVTLKGSQENGCIRVETGQVYDFVSRHFAPWYGIPEDPVTGSAHAWLGPYWSAQSSGKRQFFARQASRRGGDVHVRLLGDQRVEVGGHWKTVRRGELFL